jgi:aryl-alcohol dehydrogenase-like predicted oxidoreductase
MADIPHRPLGLSELSVSRIALGSWRTYERMERADAERVLAHALARGINFLDDARYDDETGRAPMRTGYSEVLFGELFRAVGANPDTIAVSNKLWWEFWPDQDAVGELDDSLDRMGLDRIDLLYSSTLPAEVSVPVAVEQIGTALERGRVGSWGVVNWEVEALTAASREAMRQSIPQPCAVQLPYSLTRLGWVENPAMDEALEATGASLIPSATLAGGALTGKYADSANGRLRDEREHDRHRRAFAIGAGLAEPAARLNTTPATLAVAFTLRHPHTASALVGATRPEQVDAAIDAVALADRLTHEDMAELRRLAAGTV